MISCRCNSNNKEPSSHNKECSRIDANNPNGYIVKTGCPNTWKDKKIKNHCLKKNSSNPLTLLPVDDHDKKVTFANIYCAVCNSAKNLSYWNIVFYFSNYMSFHRDKEKSIKYMFKHNYTWKMDPHLTYSNETCKASPLEAPANLEQRRVKTLWKSCLSYSLPIRLAKSKVMYKNPHCSTLQNGLQEFLCMPPSKTFPGFSLLFQFHSHVEDDKHFYVRRVRQSCPPNQVYDIYEDKCRTLGSGSHHNILQRQQESHFQISKVSNSCKVIANKSGEYVEFSNGSVLIYNQNMIYDTDTYRKVNNSIILCTNSVASNITKKSGKEIETDHKKLTEGQITNFSNPCIPIEYTSAEHEKFPNGSVLLYAHKKMYGTDEYEKVNTSIILCTNFTTNYTKSVRLQKETDHKKLTTIQILTLIGSLLSIACLVSLIIIIRISKKTKTMHGKNMMSLSCSLLVFQAMFLFSGQVEIPAVCNLMTALLHFSLLSTFMWMSVMGYDVTTSFISKWLIKM